MSARSEAATCIIRSEWTGVRRDVQWPIRSYTRRITGIVDRLKQWLGAGAQDAELAAKGGEPVATGRGANIGDQPERETSTNAQMAGASDEPWPGDEW